ncbi:MAG: hypothetical protein R2698_07380 [Microthrixaceae bacterium]
MSESKALAILSDPSLVEEKSSISFRFNRRTWTLIGTLSAIAALAGMAFTFVLPKQYVVTRTFIVTSGSNPNDNDTLIRAFQDLMGDEQFAAAIKAKTELPIPVEDVKGMISVDRPPQSATIKVAVRSTDEEDASKVSAQIVPTLDDIINSAQVQLPIENRISGPLVQEYFDRPLRQIEYVPWYVGLLGAGAMAFLLSFVVAAFRQYRRPVIASPRDVGEALDLPVLARIAAVGDGRAANPQDAVLGMLSAVERLGANGPIHRLVIVGPESDVERSKLVLALACSIARNFDQPVAVIDADLENARLTELVGAEREAGLAECLSGDVAVDHAMLRMDEGFTPEFIEGMAPAAGMIRLMPAGVDRGGSLLRMRSNLHQVLGALSGKYVVVVDGPRVPGQVPSTQLLSMADATIVVVTENVTTIRDARFAGNTLRSNTSKPVGAVVMRR